MSDPLLPNPLELTVGDVHLLLSRCFDGPEELTVIKRLEFKHGEIPVDVRLGGEFHGCKVVRIVESQLDYIVCVEDRHGHGTVLSSNRILKHTVTNVEYDL